MVYIGFNELILRLGFFWWNWDNPLQVNFDIFISRELMVDIGFCKIQVDIVFT
jgi:hypothetical protein